jgi:hypothetical protein
MKHDEALEAIGSADDPLAASVQVLQAGFEHYSWVGIYLVEGGDLVLGPWPGPGATEHVRIPVGQGVCGAAAASGRTEIVDDVNADPRYLACFPSTRSEIVVPIAHEGRVVGESTSTRTGRRPSLTRIEPSSSGSRTCSRRTADTGSSPPANRSVTMSGDAVSRIHRSRLRQHAAPDTPRRRRSHRGDREADLASRAPHLAHPQGRRAAARARALALAHRARRGHTGRSPVAERLQRPVPSS